MSFYIGLGRLKKEGILGMNRRNIDFISKYNKRSLFPLVDNKLQTKLLAQKHSINTPKLLGLIKYQHQIKDFKKKSLELNSFVIKPARGSGGKGILVISEQRDGKFIKSSKDEISFEEISRHLTNILAGLYSLNGDQDEAIVEELILIDPLFENYSYQGVPDIRIIVFKGYPVMAMLRLSTKDSDGKANLHQGAVGVGVGIRDGVAINAVKDGKRVNFHPDTKASFEDIAIPNWRELLMIASSCYEMTNLGYIGVDLVLDKNRGAMLLELNARPGLAIQIANSKGLLHQLKRVENIELKESSVEKRVDFIINAS